MTKAHPKPYIIIVEDDSLLAQMYSMHLSKAGFQVVHAQDAKSFWKLANRKRPSLILLDILLPQVNGLQVLKDIRKRRNWDSVSVIVLTNLNRVETDLTPELADLLGVSAYLLKSQTSPQQLIEWVKRALVS